MLVGVRAGEEEEEDDDDEEEEEEEELVEVGAWPPKESSPKERFLKESSPKEILRTCRTGSS